jgi:hypothetical protein
VKSFQEILGAVLGGLEEAIIAGPQCSLGKASDGPGLATGPARSVRVSLVGKLPQNMSGGGIEIDNVGCGKVVCNVVFL